MASVQDIRELVSSYVAEDISASDLANRFAPVLNAAMKSGDASVRELALDVHVQIACHFNGLISEQEMRARLKPIGDAAEQGKVTISYQIVKTVQPEQVGYNPDSRKSVVFPTDLNLVTIT